jgi:hypothetical protein
VVGLAVFLCGLPSALADSLPWQRHSLEHFLFEYHPRQQAAAMELAAGAEGVRTRLCGLIGRCWEGVTTVKIAHSEEEFLALQPYGGEIDWASGVAYAELGLIILRVDQSMLLDMQETFEHELSHVLLLRATGERPPRWFIEGVAIHQAGQDLIERFERVSQSTIAGGPLPFSQLVEGFPAGPGGRSLAYAQSGLFLAFLVERFGKARLQELITAMAYGMEFDEAVARIYGRDLADLEREWAGTLGRFSWLMALSNDWTLWTAGSLLLLLAVYLRVRRNRARRRLSDDDGRDWEFSRGK